jgi:hypothetical protein
LGLGRTPFGLRVARVANGERRADVAKRARIARPGKASPGLCEGAPGVGVVLVVEPRLPALKGLGAEALDRNSGDLRQVELEPAPAPSRPQRIRVTD